MAVALGESSFMSVDNSSGQKLAGRAFRGGVGDTPKQKCTKSDQAAGKCRKVARPLSEKRTKKKRRIKKPAG